MKPICLCLIAGFNLGAWPLAAQPADGIYEGTTVQGEEITVTVNGGNVTRWSFGYQCGPSQGTTVVETTCAVVGNSFSCGNTSCSPFATKSSIAGTFAGDSVSGTVNLRTQPTVSVASCCSLLSLPWSGELLAPAPPTLIDQSASCGSTGLTSQLFTDLAGGSDLADDFSVPGAEQWAISRVGVKGFYGSSGLDGPADSVNVIVERGQGGVPVQTVCSYPGLAPVAGSGPDFVLELDPPCEIQPGIYWLQVQGVMPLNPKGQWFWHQTADDFGEEPVFQDVLDLFSTGCTSWAPAASCFGGAEPEADLCFRIHGTSSPFDELIFEDSFESGDLSRWQ